MKEKPSCEQCKLTWKALGKGPDCEKCLPRILPGNEEVLSVYNAVQSQVRTAGMSGITIGLDHNAVWMYMDKYGIGNQLEIFEKVTRLFQHFLSEEATMRKLTTKAKRPRR